MFLVHTYFPQAFQLLNIIWLGTKGFFSGFLIISLYMIAVQKYILD